MRCCMSFRRPNSTRAATTMGTGSFVRAAKKPNLTRLIAPAPCLGPVSLPVRPVADWWPTQARPVADPFRNIVNDIAAVTGTGQTCRGRLDGKLCSVKWKHRPWLNTMLVRSFVDLAHSGLGVANSSLTPVDVACRGGPTEPHPTQLAPWRRPTVEPVTMSPPRHRVRVHRGLGASRWRQ